MSDKEYICIVCLTRFDEDELYKCSKCGELICPECGDEIVTIEEYDRNKQENLDDAWKHE